MVKSEKVASIIFEFEKLSMHGLHAALGTPE
jgi:hypothetical protein